MNFPSAKSWSSEPTCQHPKWISAHSWFYTHTSQGTALSSPWIHSYICIYISISSHPNVPPFPTYNQLLLFISLFSSSIQMFFHSFWWRLFFPFIVHSVLCITPPPTHTCIYTIMEISIHSFFNLANNSKEERTNFKYDFMVQRTSLAVMYLLQISLLSKS